MLFKLLLIGLLTFMIYNLFRAMIIMNKNDPNEPPMSKYIGRRVVISILIVTLLVLGILTGFITPHHQP